MVNSLSKIKHLRIAALIHRLNKKKRRRERGGCIYKCISRTDPLKQLHRSRDAPDNDDDAAAAR